MTHRKTSLFRLSTMDGCGCAMMIGWGETFFPALLLALTGSSINSGLVATVPLFLASLLQILLFQMKHLFPSHRSFVCTFASLQGITLLLLSVALFNGYGPTLFVFAIATLYWGFGQATAPVWNAWVSHLVPENRRLSFFSKREKWCQLATTLALISGGAFLQKFGQSAHFAFGTLFLAAAFMRLGSAILLYQHPDPPEGKRSLGTSNKKHRTIEFFQWTWRFKHIFAFLFLIKASVYFSASYFSPYMLKELKLSYIVYTSLITTSLVSRVFIMHYTEGIARKIGIKYLLLFSTLALAISPSLWSFSKDPLFLSWLQVLSGAGWACFDFSVLIYLMNTVEHQTRSKLLVGINFFYALAALLGSTLGAIAIKNWGESLESYHKIFSHSTVFRIACLAFIPSFFKHKVRVMKIATRIVALRPALGASIKPILFRRTKDKSLAHRQSESIKRAPERF